MKKIIEIAVDDMKFTIPDAKEQRGHDDSLPFGGTLHLNGKPIANCYNDGWGGEAFYEPLTTDAYKILADAKEKIAKYDFVGSMNGKDYRWTLTLPFLIDELACCQLGQFELPDKIVKKAE